MIKAVIFDMDGLLVDSEPFWREAEINCFKTVGVHLDDDLCKLTMGMRIDEVVMYWYEKYPWEGKSTSELVQDIMDEMVRLLALYGKPMKGVKSTIQLCRTLGLKLALASSSRMRLIQTVVEKLNLTHDMEVINSAEDDPYGKPHPSVFIRTAIDLGVHPEECVVLEDSFHGIIAGLAGKMKVIAVPDPIDYEKEKFSIAHHKIRSLSELTPDMLTSV